MKKNISSLNIVLRFILAIPIMIAVIFWPAGTLNWWEGWIYLIGQLGFTTFLAIYLYRNSPELLQKRMAVEAPTRLWDTLIMIPFITSFVAVLIVPGFDVIRYEWSQMPLFLEVIGFLGFAVSQYIMFAVMRENAFLLKTVEIQKDQKVVSTGPYAIVRHPMYSSVLIMAISIPLALGSLYGLIPGLFTCLFITIRTELEDRTLRQELDGYKAYTKKVGYKLIPGLW